MYTEWENLYIEEYKELIYENLYLHFFNREIYRGIYGEKVDNMQLDHSDILTTIMICGYNTLFSSFSAYHETINMLTAKGKIFRELYDYGIITVSGETLNIDINMEIKQDIYSFDRIRYAGYFGTDAKELEMIVPTLLKPDLTNTFDKYFKADSWDDILTCAPTEHDKKLLQYHEAAIRDRIKRRDMNAITKSLFQNMYVAQKLPESIGRTLSGMYVKDYMVFILGNIITGIDGLQEYDFLGKNFPYHDYKITRQLLMLLGFPNRFTVNEFEQILKHYDSKEHLLFALKVQQILHMLFGEMEKSRKVVLTIHQKRIRYLPVLKMMLSNLAVKDIDFSSINYYGHCIENIDRAIRLVKDITIKTGGNSVMNNNKVFVVTGRDKKLRLSIFHLLRALKLEPMEWMEVIENTGDASPYLSMAIKKGIDDAGAVVVIMAPEEEAQLTEELHTEMDDDKIFKQPRPNVIFEAGLALGIKESKTIILQFGNVRIFSDILGKHILHYRGKNQEVKFKNDLLQKLRIAGCNCKAGDDYYDIDIDFDRRY